MQWGPPHINKIFDLQNTIATAVEEQSSTTNEINQTVDMAAKKAADMAQNISMVSSAAEDTETAAGKSHQSSEKVAELTESLNKMIGHFSYLEA